MKLKRLGGLGSALILGISTLLTIGFAGVAHAATGTYYEWTGAASSTAGLGGCTSNCWSVYGNWKVSTNGGVSYTTATNGEVPNNTDNSGAGDNLVFDDSSLSAATTLHDDITGLTVDTITSQGTGTAYPDFFTLSGDAFSLVNGELGAAPNSIPSLTIDNNVTFSSSQTYGEAGVNYDAITFSGDTLTIPSSVTLTAASPITIPTLAGGGSLILQGPGSSTNYPNYHSILNASTLSGSIEIQSGAELSVSTVSALGTASLTIDNGGQLLITDETTSSSDTITIPNAITMAGNGSGVSQQTQGAIQASLTDTNNYQLTSSSLAVNLTGSVTLTGNTELSSVYPNATTYNITGTYNTGGFNLTSVAASQPYYGTTIIEVNGKAINVTTAAAATTKTAPKTPDTGSALTSAHIGLPMAGSLMMAGGIYSISRKVKHPIATKRR